MGMIKGGRSPRFLHEAGAGISIIGESGDQEFEGDRSFQQGILGLVYLPHSTATEIRYDAIMGYLLADHGSPIPWAMG